MRAVLLVGLCLANIPLAAAPVMTLTERESIAELQVALAAGRTTSVALTEHYLARIARENPRLNAVIAVNPDALAAAQAADRARQEDRVAGPLHGIPILIKDNVETADEMATTVGSFALAGNVTGRDADVVAALRAAGAIILGKANLSEWANFRSRWSTSGWSAVGGQTRNPFDVTRSPCGSSSGSAVAVAAGLAVAAVGTETDGSIVCPASVNGVVGFKPALGELSTRGIVPIAASQDTAGPLTRTVGDAVLLTEALGGATSQPLLAELAGNDARALLSGRRIGVVRSLAGFHPGVDARFEDAIARLAAAGAHVVDGLQLAYPDDAEGQVLQMLAYEFRRDLNGYLATLREPYSKLRLADLIAFNRNHADIELAQFGQDLFELAEKASLPDDAYRASVARLQSAAREQGIDALMKEHAVTALIAPTAGAAWTIDGVNGDHFLGGSASFAAIAGYPHLTVPNGDVRGLPVGLSIFGRPADREDLFRLARAYELIGPVRLLPE